MKTKLTAISTIEQQAQQFLTKLFSMQRAKHRFGGCVLLVAAASLPAVGYAASISLPDGFFEQGGLTWTGLIRSQDLTKANPDELTFAEAVKKCSSAINAQTGWRLPTVKDFESLLQSSAYNELLSRAHSEAAWASDVGPYRGGGSGHKTLMLEYRDFEVIRDGSTKYVTCVKEKDSIGDTQKEKAQAKGVNAGSNQSPSDKNAKNPTKDTPIVLTVHSTVAEDAAKAKAAAEAQAKKKAADEDKKKRFTAEEAKKAAAKADGEEKQRQWCLADKARLDYCGCSKYNPVKGTACLK
jgi:hypothetical protein